MKIHMIGNAHVDPAWMWPVAEGMEAFIATCRSALDRIAETEDFIFTCSSAAHYEYLLQADRVLFERIKQAVRCGTWCIVGGWWVEADCNLPSGESFARQALLGQRFFQEQFGVMARTGYCIDSFGHNANLPQLLSLAGMDRYVFMRPEGHELTLTDNLFRWRGVSGHDITAYRIPFHYSNHARSSVEKIALLTEAIANRTMSDSHAWMLFYGVGNHGGGPTIREIASIKRAMTSDDRIILSDPDRFMDGTRAAEGYKGELQYHAIGCYSAHVTIKRLHRSAEHALLAAERLGVMRDWLTGASESGARSAQLVQAWKNVCFTEFHDLLGGVAIADAMEEACDMLREARAIAERYSRMAVQQMSLAIDTTAPENRETIVVFNPTGYARSEIVTIDLWHPHASEKGEKIASVKIFDGVAMQHAQQVTSSAHIGDDRVRFLFYAEVPPLGYRVYHLEREVEHVDNVLPTRAESTRTEPNTALREIAGALRFTLVRDSSDTWSHGLDGYHDVVSELRLVNSRLGEKGELRNSIVHYYQLEGSTVRAEIYEAEDDSFAIDLRINWQHRRSILKLRFAHRLQDPRAFYEIPFAQIERTVSHREYPGQSWVFVENGNDEGVGLITESQSSFSIDEEYLNVILARSAVVAHHVPPDVMEPADDPEYLDIGEQTVRMRIVRARNLSSAEMPRRAACFHEPLVVHAESGHNGAKALSKQFVEVDAPTIKLSALKPCYDHSPDAWIARFVETDSIPTTATILFPSLGVTIRAQFGPFEIKTYRITRDGNIAEVNLIEYEIAEEKR